MPLDHRQRYEDPQEALRSVMDGRQADMWTALPGIIVSYDPTNLTVEVQPAIQALYTGADLSQKFVNLPQLVDVPVVFPRGGNYTLTFPIKPGDECMLVFMSRCMDNWWGQGGVQSQYELRMHDLSDGMAIVGPFSQKTGPQLKGASTTTTQLRTNDGTIFAELDDTTKVARIINGSLEVTLNATANTATVTAPTVNINASSQVNINTPLLTVSGLIQAAGNIIAGALGLPVGLLTHVHGRGTPIAGGTLPPTPGS